MATIIKIKRTTGSSAPSGLEQGELAYVYDTSNASTGAGGNGLRLFIGDHTSTSNAAIEIGGQYYKLLLDHAHGTLTASSALIVDSNKAIDELLVGNSATVGGTIKFNEGTNNGAHFIALKAPNSVGSSVTFTLPSADGSADHILKTDGFTGFTFPDEIDIILYNRLMELLSCYPIIRGLPKIVQAIKIGHMLVSACRRFLNAKDGKRKKSTEKSDGKSNR